MRLLRLAYPGGSLRSMSNPPFHSEPDIMSSSFYAFDLSMADNGGVHSNSGINNKAAYLMTDGTGGGTFNGRTVSALGIDKVAKIYYEVQTNLLTSGSDYGDLYNALYQACFNVIGSVGITVADCQEVRDATDAVEMNLEPPFVGFDADAPLCPAGQNPDAIVFSDDMEGGPSNWSFAATSGLSHWRYDSPYGAFAHSGSHFLYGDDFPAYASASYAAMKSSFIVPAFAYLYFSHAYGFEDGFDVFGDPQYYDGGVVEYSVNNGANWASAAGLFVDNGYDGTISSSFGNPLGGQQAFVADSHGYMSPADSICLLWRGKVYASAGGWGSISAGMTGAGGSTM